MIAVLQANLGNFDTPSKPVEQTIPFKFHCFTDKDFPPCAGLTPRLQYRIPKTHGFEMFPGYDKYLWLDGSFNLARKDSLEWFEEMLGDGDIVFFKHPARNTMREETDYIDSYLQRKAGTKRGQDYLLARYKNGFHQEQLDKCYADPEFIDDSLYTSTAFMYRNTPKVQAFLKDWWYEGSRHFTCDQIVLPYLGFKHKLKLSVINENQYDCMYLKEASKHK